MCFSGLNGGHLIEGKRFFGGGGFDIFMCRIGAYLRDAYSREA